MPAPKNLFKQALADKVQQIGLWVALGSSNVAEICASAGYDWVLIDGEHGPNDIPLIAAQLQAVAPHPAKAVVRLPIGEAYMVKQALDIGAQSLLIPMVETAEHAHAMVRASRYAPQGMRGVGASIARASGFGRISDYMDNANDEICITVQIESRAGIANLDAITQVEGVDGVFIGPADLAADMGFGANAAAPEVQATIKAAILRIRELGKPVGIMTADIALAHRYVETGANFVAIGSDTGVLMRAATKLVADFRAGVKPAEAGSVSGY